MKKKTKTTNIEKTKPNQIKPNHIWAAKKQLFPKGPEKTPKGGGF